MYFNVHISMYVRVHVHVHILMYICMYVYMYMYMYIHMCELILSTHFVHVHVQCSCTYVCPLVALTSMPMGEEGQKEEVMEKEREEMEVLEMHVSKRPPSR